jgi:hypothetical protein
MTEIVTICGSMKFVLAPFSVVSQKDQNSDFKQMLDKLHREKIDMATSLIIVVVNQHGYTGKSTKAEMVYAANQGKTWDVREFYIEEGSK